MAYKNLEFFIYYIFPIIVLVLGLIGNNLGIAVVLRKRLKSIGPTHIYCYMFLADTAYLVQIIISYLNSAYGIHVSVYSRLSCKLWVYFNYAFGNTKVSTKTIL